MTCPRSFTINIKRTTCSGPPLCPGGKSERVRSTVRGGFVSVSVYLFCLYVVFVCVWKEDLGPVTRARSQGIWVYRTLGVCLIFFYSQKKNLPFFGDERWEWLGMCVCETRRCVFVCLCVCVCRRVHSPRMRAAVCVCVCNTPRRRRVGVSERVWETDRGWQRDREIEGEGESITKSRTGREDDSGLIYVWVGGLGTRVREWEVALCVCVCVCVYLQLD